jgi:Cu+-exporting ATPase
MSFDTLVYVALLGAGALLMFRFGCGRHMTSHGHSQHRHEGARDDGPSSAAQSDVDVVCGMKVDGASEQAAVFEGRTYRFCSETCRKTFEASPANYAIKAQAARSEHGHRHGCCR